MILDILIRNADLVDGTGEAMRRADIGVKDGRIVAVAEAGEVDASGDASATGRRSGNEGEYTRGCLTRLEEEPTTTSTVVAHAPVGRRAVCTVDRGNRRSTRTCRP